MIKTAALERAVHRRPRPPADGERCSLCAVEIPDDHPHLLDSVTGRPLCSCRACALLFQPPDAAHGRYRRIPERREPLPGLEPAELPVPVGLAFFVVTGDGSVVAHYPSPAGATRCQLDVDDWQSLVTACPRLNDLEPLVEAALVNRVGAGTEAWLVPVADCYALVGRLRTQWEGLSGGKRVGKAVETFFDELRRRHGTDTRRHPAGPP